MNFRAPLLQGATCTLTDPEANASRPPLQILLKHTPQFRIQCVSEHVFTHFPEMPWISVLRSCRALHSTFIETDPQANTSSIQPLQKHTPQVDLNTLSHLKFLRFLRQGFLCSTPVGTVFSRNKVFETQKQTPPLQTLQSNTPHCRIQ